MPSLEFQFCEQVFLNDYELIDGVAKQEEFGKQFQIPPPVIKRHVAVGHFVELRLDSLRFSMHQEDAAQCSCPSCSGELSSPILRHDHPATLVPLPPQPVPSRGWGEDFWGQVIQREGDFFSARVDNPLVESRLHGVQQEQVIYFREYHVLAVHASHRLDMVSGMEVEDIKELAQWLGEQNEL
ncbi:MAG: hypothetical protein VXZ82_02685 [Planctomycetota bacterium]|nr:hypothetical protein [Planctomycetota bacterium]